jgi:hypothetical protein
MGRPDHMHDWPLHLGCFRGRREKTRGKEPKTRKEPREGERPMDQSRKRALRRDEVAGKMEGQMIRNNMSA